MEKKYRFHVHGMHCRSCVMVTESKVGELPHVSEARSDLSLRVIDIVGNFDGREEAAIAEELSELLSPHGYRLALVPEEEAKRAVAWSDFRIAIPIALVFMAVFIGLQKIGIINLVDATDLTYGVAFGIGIVASLSTCMAVVGGLVLSLGATFSARDPKTGKRSLRPQFLFHIGRLLTFFVLGGAIGSLGAAFALNAATTFILTLLVGLVMLVMGLNLVGFGLAKRMQPVMPKILSKLFAGKLFNQNAARHSAAPFLIGAATFFLPCGFTQSMQIFTLSTGTFLSGGLTMLAFALGTLPVLALLSFGSFNIQKSPKAGIFLKTAGLIVLLFALFNILNSLAVIGLIPPVISL